MSKVPVSAAQAHTSWQAQCGPLQTFLEDPSVTEIMVNGPGRIFIEQKGLLKKTAARFENSEQLVALMVAMARAIGRNLDFNNPCVDGRLPDGSRINCVVPPIAVDGPALTIRKFSRDALTYSDLIQAGALDERMAFFLNTCVLARLNVVVCGGTGSGKTTLLNVLTSFIPPHERIVTIEDTAELKVRNENVVRLESRAPTPGDTQGVPIRSLVINSLRMRPDRILVGECRGPEAFDMLQAMNTGHEGSMTTVHANSARDCLRRLETMILMAGTEMPLKVIRQNISSALHLIVFAQRCSDGIRRIVEIIEIGGMEGDVILSQDIFRYQAGTGFKSSGMVPGFMRLFRERNIDFPPDFFTDQYKVRQVGAASQNPNTSTKKK
jgi:pilus assembly protein CpaF